MSKLKVSAIHDPDNDNQALTIDSSGNVTASQNLTVSGTLSGDGSSLTGISSPLSFRNLIINGDMQVAQRGTSSTSTGCRTVDRFKNNFSTVGITQTQSDVASGTDPYALGFRKSYKSTNTSTTTSTSAYALMTQQFEAQNITNSGWDYTSSSSYVTVSFWVKSSLAGTYPVEFRSEDGTQQHYVSEFTLSANTWTKITKTVSGNSSVTVNNDTGTGLNLLIWLDAGTNYTSSSLSTDSWTAYSGSAQVKDFAQSWMNTSGATFELTGVQLEVGSSATEFEHRSYGEELQRCLRYFFKPTKDSGAGAISSGYWYSSSSCRAILHLPVTMRTNPTVSHDDVTDVRLGYGGGSTAASGYNGTQGSSKNAVWMDYASAAAGGSGNGAALYMYPGNPGVQFDAEL